MRRLTSPLIAVSTVALTMSLLVAAPAGAAAPTAQIPASSVPLASQPVPRIDWSGVPGQILGVASTIIGCEEFSKNPQACFKNPSTADIMRKLEQIEAQMARNQAETMRALDLLQLAMDNQDLFKAVKDLAPVQSHIFEALNAWEALSKCAERAAAKVADCEGYNGKQTAKLPISDAMARTQEFFLDQMGKIGLSVEQSAQYFAGTRSVNYQDGLAAALWKVAKRQQDRQSGARSPGELPLQPVVVTSFLSGTVLPTLTYYRDMVYLYGALRPAAKALKKQATKAEAEANLAEKTIFSGRDRSTVTGAFEFYKIPSVPTGSIAFVDGDGKLLKITPGEGKGTRLTAKVVQDLGQRLHDYGYKVSSMAQSELLLPNRGSFGVWEKVLHRYYPYWNDWWAICPGVTLLGCNASPYVAPRRESFELGHPGAVGSRDEYQNPIRMFWVSMRLWDEKVSWSGLKAGAFGSYGGSQIVETGDSGAWNLKFRAVFDKLVAGTYAMYEWERLAYGESTRYVGPGIYVATDRTAARAPYSVVDKGKPAGVLVK